MADVFIDPSNGKIYWNDGSDAESIAIDGNTQNQIKIIGYSAVFSPGSTPAGALTLATFNDNSGVDALNPGTNAYSLGSATLRWKPFLTTTNISDSASALGTNSTSLLTGVVQVNGGIAISGNASVGQSILFFNNSNPIYFVGFTASSSLASTQTYTLPLTYPSTGTSVLQSTSAGVMSWVPLVSSTATTSENINISLSGAANTAFYLPFTRVISGSGVALSTDSTLSFNPSTEILSLSGLAVTATTASGSTNTGSITIAGGLGLAGNAVIGGTVSILSEQASVGDNTGPIRAALLVSGGIGASDVLVENKVAIGVSWNQAQRAEIASNYFRLYSGARSGAFISLGLNFNIQGQNSAGLYVDYAGNNNANTRGWGIHSLGAVSDDFALTTTDGTRQVARLSIGTGVSRLATVVIGNSLNTFSGLAITSLLRGVDGTGTDDTSGDFRILAGRSTGTGLNRGIRLQVASPAAVSGSGTNTEFDVVRIVSIQSATSTTSASMYVYGGLGVTGNAIIGGTFGINDTSNSTSFTTGSLIVSGGAGFAKSINVNGNIGARSGFELRAFNSGDTNYSSFKYTGSTDTPYTLPTAYPSTGTSVLQSDANGNLSWVIGGGVVNNGLVNQLAYYQATGTAITGSGNGLTFSTNNLNSLLTMSAIGQTQPSTLTLIGDGYFTAGVAGTNDNGIILRNKNGLNVAGSDASNSPQLQFISEDFGASGSTAFVRYTMGGYYSQFSLRAGVFDWVKGYRSAPGLGGAGGTGAAFDNNLLLIVPGTSGGFSTFSNANPGTLNIYLLNAKINTTTNSTSTTTGALIVSGGAGIAGTVNIGSRLRVSSTQNSTSTIDASTVITGGLGMSGNAFIGGTVTIYDATNSISSSTGSLTLSGGVGIGLSASVGGRLQLFNGANYTAFVSSASGNTVYTLPATSPSTGSSVLQSTSAGVMSWVPLTSSVANTANSVAVNQVDAISTYYLTGVSANLPTVGSGLSASSSLYLDATNNTLYSGFTLNSGITNNATGSGYQNASFYGDGGIAIAGNAFIGQTVTIEDLTNSTGTNSGALVVRGGAGFALSASIGGRLQLFNGSNYTAFVSSASGNTVYTLPATSPSTGSSVLQSTSAGVMSWVPMTAGGSGSVNSGTAGSVAFYAADGTAVSGTADIYISSGNGITINPVTNSTSTTTGALVVKGGVGVGGTVSVGQRLTVGSSLNSTSTTTGALINSGGLGLAGNAFIGGTVTMTDTTNSTSSSTGSLVLSGGVGIAGTISVGQRLTVGSTLNSSSTTTGAEVNSGGLGLAGNAFIGGTVTMTNTTNSTSSSTGALVLSGGAGIAGTVFLGGTLSSIGASIYGIIYTNAIQIGQAGNNINFLDSSGSTLANINTSNGWLRSAQSTESTSATTGALVSAGGLGVAKNAFFGGTGSSVTVNGTSNSTSTTTGALVVAGGFGLASNAFIGGTVTLTNTTVSTSSSTGALVLSGSAGVAGTVSVGQRLTVGSTLNASSTTTGALVNSGGLGLAGNAFIGGTVVITNTTNSTSINSGALEIDGGAAIALSASIGGRLQLFNASNYTAFVSSASGNTVYTLPATSPSTGSSVLQSTSAGVMSWVPMTSGGSATPGGLDTAVQFNDGGSAFGGTSYFTFSKTTQLVSIGATLNATAGYAAGLRLYNDQSTSASAVLRRSAPAIEMVGIANTGVITGGKFNRFAMYVLGENQSYEANLRFMYSNDTGTAGFSTIFQINSLYGAGLGASDASFVNYFRSSSTQAANKTYILPTDYPSGTATSFLSASTTGTMAWVAPPAGSGSPGGSNKQIQFNSSSSFGGASGFEYATAGNAITVSMFSPTGTGYTSGLWVHAINGSTTRIGIGLSNPSYELEIVGELSATNKSFVIDHPTKPGMKLRYGSLEGPENGVYVRGQLIDENVIETPDYWRGLVYEDTFTVHLTPIGKYQQLYVEKIEDYKVYISNSDNSPINCYYSIWAERKDVPKLIVEY